jgi:hypothetical protein
MVEKLFFRLERSGENDAQGFAVCAVDAENANTARRSAHVEVARLSGKAGAVWHEAEGKGILERFLDVLDGDRVVQAKGWIAPIKFHKRRCKSIGHALYILCKYINRHKRSKPKL